jgi:hypothetical protein
MTDICELNVDNMTVKLQVCAAVHCCCIPLLLHSTAAAFHCC